MREADCASTCLLKGTAIGKLEQSDNMAARAKEERSDLQGRLSRSAAGAVEPLASRAMAPRFRCAFQDAASSSDCPEFGGQLFATVTTRGFHSPHGWPLQ